MEGIGQCLQDIKNYEESKIQVYPPKYVLMDVTKDEVKGVSNIGTLRGFGQLLNLEQSEHSQQEKMRSFLRYFGRTYVEYNLETMERITHTVHGLNKIDTEIEVIPHGTKYIVLREGRTRSEDYIKNVPKEETEEEEYKVSNMPVSVRKKEEEQRKSQISKLNKEVIPKDYGELYASSIQDLHRKLKRGVASDIEILEILNIRTGQIHILAQEHKGLLSKSKKVKHTYYIERPEKTEEEVELISYADNFGYVESILITQYLKDVVRYRKRRAKIDRSRKKYKVTEVINKRVKKQVKNRKK